MVEELKALYEEIDLFLGGVVAGERVELIITPGPNADERIITIGIQNGLSRDRSSFKITDGKTFDEKILPKIVSYYEEFDKYIEPWQVNKADNPNQTNKALLETENGNLLYLETRNAKLFDSLKENKAIPQKISLSEEELEWQAIIEYVKARRVTSDFLKNNLNDAERRKLESLLAILSNNKKFVVGSSKSSKAKVCDNLNRLLNAVSYSDDLVDIGINRDAYNFITNYLDRSLCDKIKDTVTVEHLAASMQAEQRIEKFIEENKDNLSTSLDVFKEKKLFALMEMSRTNYYDKRNISYDVLLKNDQKGYKDNCFGEIQKLKNLYEEGRIFSLENEKKKERYIKYCYEVLGYLTSKSKEAYYKKENRINLDVDVAVKDNSDVYIDNIEKLLEKINLCKDARVNKEKFELIIMNSSDKDKRLVRVALKDGLSRSDSFEFEFTDGNKFDLEILPKVMDIVTKDDKIVNTEKTDSKTDTVDKRVLLSTEEGNEILIDQSILDSLEEEKVTNEKDVEEKIVNKVEYDDKEQLKEYLILLAEKRRKERLRDNGQLPSIGIQALKSIDFRLQELSRENEKVAKLADVIKQKENKEINDEVYQEIYDTYVKEVFEEKNKDLDYDIDKLKNDIKKYAKEKFKIEENKNKFSYYDKFDELQDLAQKYDIKDNSLIIDKNTKEEYTPKTNEEKEKIKFALDWNNKAKVEESAFNDNLRSLFNIMDVYFEVAINNGLIIDLESIRKQFQNTLYDKANIVYDNLFNDREHVKYMIDYYLGQLKMKDTKKSDDFILDLGIDEELPIKDKKEKEEIAIKEIKEAYLLANSLSTKEKPAAIKIFFSNDLENEGEIIVSHGIVDDESVLYINRFSKTFITDVILQDICDIYVENSGIINNEIYEIPNTNKAGSITLGKNDNLLQLSNASKKDVNKIQLCLRNSEYKFKLSKNNSVNK